MKVNSKEILIKEAKPEDAALVSDFVYRLICELDNSEVEVNLSDYRNAFNEMISNKDNRIFMASDGNKEIGIITVVQSISIYAPGKFGVINELYILPEYRCFGIGKRLVDQVIEFGKQICWKRIEVGAPNNETWHRTIEFYLREGFVEIGPRLKKYL